MLRLFYLLLVAAALWYAWRVWQRLAGPSRPRRHRAVPAAERMVRCAHCQVHLPESAALRDGERFFCSPEHRERERR